MHTLPPDQKGYLNNKHALRALLVLVIISGCLILGVRYIESLPSFQPAHAQTRYTLTVPAPSEIVNPTLGTTPTTAQSAPNRAASATVPPTPLELHSPQDEPPESQATNGILILAMSEGAASHLFAYNPFSLSLTRLTSGRWQDMAPAASPDGKFVAFSSDRDGSWDLYLLELATGSLVQLTDSPEYKSTPSWSPDGRWLVYEAYLEPEGQVHPPAAVDHDGNFPETTHPNLDLVIIPTSPDNPAQYHPLRLTEHESADYAPAWSPTGRQIAFVSTRTGDADIWVADLDRPTNRLVNLSRSPEIQENDPVWSPDGTGLVWSANHSGMSTLMYQTFPDPLEFPQNWGSGSKPTWVAEQGIIYSIYETPNENYLTGYKSGGKIGLAPIFLPGTIQGTTWSIEGLPEPLPDPISSAAVEPLESDNRSKASSFSKDSALRSQLITLAEIDAPYPLLSERVGDTFAALRAATADAVSWDFLATLENAFVPMTTLLDHGIQENWLYTGRAIAVNQAALDAGWLTIVREDYGTQTYWRVYLRTRFQDGSSGQVLKELPWNLNARLRGDPQAYENGGQAVEEIPPGYWFDFTALALEFGWQRQPALSTWHHDFNAANYNVFTHSEGLSWRQAMLDIYPSEAIATATAVIPPSFTPTKTRWPTQTPTITRTPWPSRTPTWISTPDQ